MPFSSPSRTTALADRRCVLCNSVGGVLPLQFHQLYSQADAEPAVLSWAECRQCRGWFADPMPSSEQIAKHWQSVDYADLDNADSIGAQKIPLFTRIMDGLAQRICPGSLLDIGCNFGKFLSLAQYYGWKPVGIEPNPQAAKCCIDAGFDVRSGWDLQECGFADQQFAAVTAIDVFCYSLHPFSDLVAYRRLLRAGGVLAMRLTSKHAAIKVLSALKNPARRDAAISRLLLGQFHSASPRTIRHWLEKADFADISIHGRAMACPWSEAHWRSRLAYGGAELLRAVTLGAVSLSPGILVFAQRPQ